MSDAISSAVSNKVQALVRLAKAKKLPSPSQRRALRLAAGLTIADIADALDVSTPAAWRWETGRGMPRSRETAVAYAALLDSLALLVEPTTEDPAAR